MTETLFQKLEEKMMTLLSEIELLRKEVSRLTNENGGLKSEKENNMQKLQGLVSLLDSMNLIDSSTQSGNMPLAKPVLVQG